jgi:hypothetical protein
MKIDIRPNLDQIRFIAESALHAWDFQDLEAGRAQVIEDMTALLEYLAAFDNGAGVVVAGALSIKDGIRLERSTRDGDLLDLVHRYVRENTVVVDPSERERARSAVIENVWAQINRHSEHRKGNHGATADGPAK